MTKPAPHPQVAAYAEHHLCVRKAPGRDGRIVTEIMPLVGEVRLCQLSPVRVRKSSLLTDRNVARAPGSQATTYRQMLLATPDLIVALD